MGASSLALGSSEPAGGAASGVSSFNGRTGAVLPAPGDYPEALIGPSEGTYAVTYTGAGLLDVETWTRPAPTPTTLKTVAYSYAGNLVSSIVCKVYDTDGTTIVQRTRRKTRRPLGCLTWRTRIRGASSPETQSRCWRRPVGARPLHRRRLPGDGVSNYARGGPVICWGHDHNGAARLPRALPREDRTINHG